MSKNKTKFEVFISKSVSVQLWGDIPSNAFKRSECIHVPWRARSPFFSFFKRKRLHLCIFEDLDDWDTGYILIWWQIRKKGHGLRVCTWALQVHLEVVLVQSTLAITTWTGRTSRKAYLMDIKGKKSTLTIITFLSSSLFFLSASFCQWGSRRLQ